MAAIRICSVSECNNHVRCKGLCGKHYQAFRAHGDPLHKKRAANGEAFHFFRNVVLQSNVDECLIWPHCRDENGYARIGIERRNKSVSRLVCTEINGDPLPGQEAAHSCGKGHLGCVNPRHLSWKSRKENQRDRLEHGTDNRGEKCGSAKLTRWDVLEIRRLRGLLTQRAIAKRFGIACSTVCRIQNKIDWAWI